MIVTVWTSKDGVIPSPVYRKGPWTAEEAWTFVTNAPRSPLADLSWMEFAAQLQTESGFHYKDRLRIEVIPAPGTKG